MSKRTLKIPSILHRQGTSEIGEDGCMKLSISSDTPYKRYDWMDDSEYFEVLDHGPSGMDMGRLKGGAPLLFNHKRDVQLGTICDPVMEGGRCYVTAKLSKADDVRSYITRVEEGILKDTSVGYSIEDEGECIGAKDGIPIYKFRWSPHEASLVTIPADTSVGVGRQREDSPEEFREITVTSENTIDNPPKIPHTRTTPTTMPEVTDPPAQSPNIELIGKTAEQKLVERQDRIDAYVDAIKRPDWRESAAKIATKHKRSGADFDAFRTEALDTFADVVRVETPQTEIGMTKKELKSYSLAKAILNRYLNKPLTGIEKEASDATAKLLNKDADGFFIPEDWSNRSLQEIHGLDSQTVSRQLGQLQRTLTAGSFTSAGALIGTDLLSGSLIELLRNKTVMLSLGVTSLGGLVGNVAIPRQSGGATAYWLPEGGSVTASDQTFQQLGLTPKRLVAQTAYDKQLLAQASVSVEAIVRNDIALVMAIKKDLAIINGLGAAGEPQGILNQASVGTITFSAAATWAKIVSFETALAVANADQTGSPVWVTTPAVRGAWKVAPKIGSTFPVFLWENNMVNGYPAYVTNQVPSDKVLFGVPSEIIDATWAGIDVVVNPYSLDSTGQIRTTITSWHDLALRHGPAWQVSTDSGAQ